MAGDDEIRHQLHNKAIELRDQIECDCPEMLHEDDGCWMVTLLTRALTHAYEDGRRYHLGTCNACQRQFHFGKCEDAARAGQQEKG